MPTLRDVAKAANVSVATVSKVLNNKGTEGGIPLTTQARIFQAAQRLNYTPNRAARELRLGTYADTISLVSFGPLSVYIVSPFFSNVIHELENHASEEGFRLMYSRLEETDEYSPWNSRVTEVISSETRAVITLGRVPQCLSHVLQAVKPKLVGIEPYSDLVKNAVYIDNAYAIEYLVTYLVEKCGCRRLGLFNLVSPDRPMHGPYREREEAFARATERHSDSLEFAMIRHVTVNRDFLWGESARRTIRDLMTQGQYDGILCVNDVLAAEVLKAAQAEGIRVPEELCITGFDNLYWTEYTHPALTTMWISADEVAGAVMDLLLEKTKEKDIRVRPYPVLRESTR